MEPLVAGIEGGGEEPYAYYIDSPLPWTFSDRQFFIRTDYDCFGLPFERSHTWKQSQFYGVLPGGPGQFTSFGWLRSDVIRHYGMIVDVRSVESMLAGCCPPAIFNEIAGTEGIPG